jgi:magnesium transporter
MQREVVNAPEHWNVGEMIDYLRAHKADLPEQFYHVILTDPRMKPTGYITLGRLLSTPRKTGLARSPRTVSAPSPRPSTRTRWPMRSTSIT